MKRTVVAAVLLLLALVAVGLVARRLGWLDAARIGTVAVRLRHGHDPSVTAPLFVLAFAGATALGVPGSPFMLASGVLFGVVLGTALSLVGVAAGGVAGYAIARAVGRGAVDRFLGRHRSVQRVVRSNGFWTLLRLRLIPIVPLSVGNFAGGLARMPLGAFVLATVLGVAPFAAIYAYLATTLLWGAEEAKRSTLWSLTLASLALVGASFVPMIAKRLRRAHARRRTRATA